MFTVKDSENFGLCKGIVKGEPFCPKKNVTKINVQIMCNRKNPKANRYERNLLNFTAYGQELADNVANSCHDGDIITVVYHLKEVSFIDKKTGVFTTYTETVIDSIENCGAAVQWKQPNVNKGFLQGMFLGVYEVPTTCGIYIVDMMRKSRLQPVNEHFKFYVYGVLGEKIGQRFSKGKEAIVEYKLEKSRRESEGGKTDYYLNCVIERMT